ncbi:hypothetical protein [Nocardia carnea]|uniref:hypothetical protein n=1 Tax=Nocardia carnea TaxID=37328 RepID=UPI0002EA5774|nr:hypothetical protein [Nocardia carnea]
MITTEKTRRPATFTLDQMVTSDDPTVYVDPFPTAHGDDRVKEPCRCDNGLYHGPTNARWNNGHGEAPWCFYCNGAGHQLVKVRSVRARIRRDARDAAHQRDAAPYRAWLIAEAAYLQLLADEEAAYAEQERRNNLTQGFAGEIGAKITDHTAVVTVAYPYEKANHFSYRMETGMLLVLTLDNGQVLKWSSTAMGAFGYDRGDRVRIVRATVKAHDTYKGQDQTVLKNVRLERIDTAADE